MWNLWKETSFGGIEWSLHQLEVPSSKTSYASLVGLLYPLPLVNLIFRIFFSSSVSACQLSNNHGFVYLLLHMEVVFPLALSIMLRPKKKNKEFGNEKGGRGVRENNWLWMLCIKHTHTHTHTKLQNFYFSITLGTCKFCHLLTGWGATVACIDVSTGFQLWF